MNRFIKTIAIFLSEVAIKWQDEQESIISLTLLRNNCPCAGCSGEKDALGNIYTLPQKKLQKIAFQVIEFELIGLYGVRFFWKDGHSDGIYTLNKLKRLSLCE